VGVHPRVPVQPLAEPGRVLAHVLVLITASSTVKLNQDATIRHTLLPVHRIRMLSDLLPHQAFLKM
jgi:hypothetical protein